MSLEGWAEKTFFFEPVYLGSTYHNVSHGMAWHGVLAVLEINTAIHSSRSIYIISSRRHNFITILARLQL